jgi:hypothetical protein
MLAAVDDTSEDGLGDVLPTIVAAEFQVLKVLAETALEYANKEAAEDKRPFCLEAAAGGQRAIARFLRETHPDDSASRLIEEFCIAQFRGRWRDADGPINADGTPWLVSEEDEDDEEALDG